MFAQKETPVEFARWLDTQVVSWRHARSPAQRYGVAVGLVFLAALLWHVVGPDLAQEARWIVFVLVVAVTFVLLGVGPGLVTVALCTIFGLYFAGRPSFAAMFGVSVMFAFAAAFVAWTRNDLRSFTNGAFAPRPKLRTRPSGEYPAPGAPSSQNAASPPVTAHDFGEYDFAEIEIGAVLAHEITQPLSAIANYAVAVQKCLQGKSDPESLAALEAIGKVGLQARRAAEIVAGLPRIARRDFSTRRRERMTDVIEEVFELARASSKVAEIEFRLQVDPDADSARIDRVQIQQVLYNLVRNAIEAMADCDRKTLIVATRPLDADRIEVSVADTGPGIPSEVLPRLFRPVPSRKPNGMGLGLSISRSLLELHGGSIRADVNPGGGAIFRIALPVECGEEPQDAV